MFDIGFWELLVIAVIGIVVVGPDRLPEVVRTIMVLVRKARRMFQDVKQDIENELDLDDLRRTMRETEIDEHIRKLNRSVMDAGLDVQNSGKSLLNSIDDDVEEIRKNLNDTVPSPSRPLEKDTELSSKTASGVGIVNDLALEKEKQRQKASRDAVIDPPEIDGEAFSDTGIEPQKTHTVDQDKA